LNESLTDHEHNQGGAMYREIIVEVEESRELRKIGSRNADPSPAVWLGM